MRWNLAHFDAISNVTALSPRNDTLFLSNRAAHPQKLPRHRIMGSKRDACLATLASFTLAVMTTVGIAPKQKNFRVLRKLGNGKFGSVFEVQDKDEAGKTLACKQIRRTKLGIEDFQQVLDETTGCGRCRQGTCIAHIQNQ